MKISSRRVVAISVVLCCHLTLLLFLLMPVTYRSAMVSASWQHADAMDVRLVSKPREVPSPQAPAKAAPPKKAVVQPPAPVHAARLVRNEIPSRKAVTKPSPQTPEAEETLPAAAPPADGAAVRSESGDSPPSAGDGGFRDRLLNAQRSGDVTRVPGSDASLAPGIQLTDPMNQGVGAVLRNTQRLFGVTNHHCKDVDVWEHLSPEELNARHLSPADVKREREKYNCDRPLGLSF